MLLGLRTAYFGIDYAMSFVTRSPPVAQSVATDVVEDAGSLGGSMEFDVPEFRVRTSSDATITRMRGSKRPATSPAKAFDEFTVGPPPLSDLDLQKLKEGLSAMDLSFAAINAVSKESVTKKKELEQIIAAYRQAVDKLATAYVQIRAERDTTVRIWRVMKAGSSYGNGMQLTEETVNTMSQRIKEAVSVEVGRVVADLRQGAPELVARQRSYAGVTRSMPLRQMPDPGDSASGMETLEIVPSDLSDSRYRDAAATYSKVCSTIKPDEMGVRVDRIMKGPNKSVRVVARPCEIDKIRPLLENTGLSAKQFEKLNPRLIVRDIPSSVDKDQFVNFLVKQNMQDADKPKLVYWLPARDQRNASAVIEVPPEVRGALLSQGRVYIGWTSCRVSDHLRVTQCYKCLGFGHIAKSCKAEEDVCGHCTERHESRRCPNKSNTPRCHNCIKYKMSAIAHSAFDASSCPSIIRRLNEKSKRINY